MVDWILRGSEQWFARGKQFKRKVKSTPNKIRKGMEAAKQAAAGCGFLASSDARGRKCGHLFVWWIPDPTIGE
jgi:hypothetical protein